GQLKESYEIEVKLALQKFTAALEPLLIVLLAGGVGFIVFACLMPILEATRGMQ
ncbi:MAG: type II secretion system F family protein, partial [Phycisphaerae bacterium]|nr:type II secretion system F family protein [Phycisphaerae bacterium]